MTLVTARRFHHLSTGQRAEIYRTITAAMDKLPVWAAGSRHRNKVDAALKLARKFGVRSEIIIDVYEYLATKHHEAEVS